MSTANRRVVGGGEDAGGNPVPPELVIEVPGGRRQRDGRDADDRSQPAIHRPDTRESARVSSPRAWLPLSDAGTWPTVAASFAGSRAWGRASANQPHDHRPKVAGE